MEKKEKKRSKTERKREKDRESKGGSERGRDIQPMYYTRKSDSAHKQPTAV